MRERTPTVSLGMPVYNGHRYLPNALTALLNQDYEDFELIICDNASTDATPDICRAFAERDRRIRYYRNATNIGLAANHNRTFELARGRFFKWAAHDDDFPRAMLGRFVEVFEHAPPTVAVVYSRCQYIDENGALEWVDSDEVDLDDASPCRRLAHLLDRIHMYNCPYGLIRSDLLRRTRMHLLLPGSDYILCAELAMLGVFVEIPEPLLRIRRHPNRTFTANRSARALRELFNPGHARRLIPIGMNVRMELEVVLSAMIVPDGLRDKLLCTAVAAVKPPWRSFRAFGGRQKRKLLSLCTGETAPASGGES
jgi:glycosyltransferase involved in cell wall biosynthesis